MDEIEREEDDDEIVNVVSEKFNPLRALYSDKLIVPYPSAPVLDNVAKADSLLSKNENLFDKTRPPARPKKEPEPSVSREKEDPETARQDKGVKPFRKNVLTRMTEMKGPLAFLRSCMDKRIRVKVWTRSARTLRGHCMGYVAAFDKHWNLALEDVEEEWTRPAKRKKFLYGEGNELPKGWKAMGPMIVPPIVTVAKVSKGTEHCRRHVNQMLMRGEHIAFISVADK